MTELKPDMFYAVERWRKILRQLCRTLKIKLYFLWWIKVGTLVIILVLILLSFVVFQMRNGTNQRLHMSHSSCFNKEGAKMAHAQSVQGIMPMKRRGKFLEQY